MVLAWRLSESIAGWWLDPKENWCQTTRSLCGEWRLGVNYRSFADLPRDILENLHKVPSEVDLIVGVPRSGMLAAYQIALLRNLNVCSVDEFLANAPLQHGSTRTIGGSLDRPSDAKNVLVVDDSISTGGSMAAVRQKLLSVSSSQQIGFSAIYASAESVGLVDVHFVELSMPRIFQWNLLHRRSLDSVYFDMDGVLCADPTPQENDDGPMYLEFLKNARPLALPSRRLGGIITSRLEKYRGPTEEWLNRHGVSYGALHMLDLPTVEERRRTGAHAAFKAQVYGALENAGLFVESDSKQAQEIARRTGKPVLDYSWPEGGNLVYRRDLIAKFRRKGRSILNRFRVRWFQRSQGKSL